MSEVFRLIRAGGGWEMTTDEIRNWLAENQHTSDRSVVDTRDNAYPHTLDGAAKALPEGMRACIEQGFGEWWWSVWEKVPECFKWGWMRVRDGADQPIKIIYTGDEIHDRYKLAMEARKAMKGASNGTK